jgi:hypothetical protein
MAAPIAGIAIRYVVQRAAGFTVKTIAKQYGKRTSRQRMVEVAKKLGGRPMAPAPQGPYYAGFESMQSTRGEHRISSGTPKARKTMRGGSAQKRSRRPRKARPSRKRDEEYSWIDSQGTRRYRKLQ